LAFRARACAARRPDLRYDDVFRCVIICVRLSCCCELKGFHGQESDQPADH
jgi:hypothetical protein